MASFDAFPEVWDAVYDAAVAHFASTAATVYEGESGDDPFPHVVMHDVGGRGLDGPQSDPHAWAVLHYQFNCLHPSFNAVNDTRKMLHALLLANSPPQPVGAVIKFIGKLVPVPMFRDDSTASRPLWMSRDVFAVHAEKIPA